MARDDFPKPVVERLARRVGMKCSNPDCRQPTSGPDGDRGVTNTGVAAHISAASPGGARYDENLTGEQRSDIANGIWLCQTHAKLIDDDEHTFTIPVLYEWKELAEHMAAVEARGFSIQRAARFPQLEKKCPTIVAEMREDLTREPLIREFIVISRRVTMNGHSKPCFTYCLENHEYLESMMTIMQNEGAIRDARRNQVPRFEFTEPFVAYLIGE